MQELSLKEYQQKVRRLEREYDRNRVIRQAAARLRELIPPTFPKNFTGKDFWYHTKPVPNTDDMPFRAWTRNLLVTGKHKLLFKYEYIYRHVLYDGWKDMNDIELSFEALAIAWKPLVSVRVSVVMNEKVKAQPPIDKVYVYVEVV